ncbi:S9 family peptidase [bacterium]|nr:S9 family peptidase [bacterium]
MMAACMIMAFGGESHPFSVHDLLAMDRISEPQVSPDGRQIVFVIRKTDLDANKGRKSLYLVRTDGSGLRRLTQHEAGDFSPVWSPDGGSVYFLSSRSGTVQVWRIPVSGGEAEQITQCPLDVGMLKLSRDGRMLCVSMEVFPGKSVAETAHELEVREKSKSTGVIYQSVFIRHWDTWKDGRRSHLFMVPAAGGEPVDLMPDMDTDSPTKPWGGPEEVAFTLDGKGLVFTARDAGKAEAWSTNFDLYFVPLDGSQAPARITDNPAWDTAPAFSPDGRTLAYLAMKQPDYESDRFRIVLREWHGNRAGGEVWTSEEWDRSPGSFFWGTDNKILYATADDMGQRALFEIDIRKGKIRKIQGSGTVRFAQTAGKSIVFGMDHLRSPVELYSLRPDRKITSINANQLAAVQMGEPEQFSFKGWNDETVYGYIVKPAGFDPSEKYPVAFLIHGGPQGSFGNDFHYRWNPQVYAGAGYAAVMVDFHGSTGYGQAFTDAIHDDWGGKPLDDLKNGLKAALAACPWMDADRVAALGASYGGYMINWIAGNWPDRFRCLVNHDGNFDTRMAYYDTEELWFPEWDHAGTPWDNPEHFEKHNPANYVGKWQTPMLVVHGQNDYRVPVTQGIATFNALQRRGIPSQMLYFPDENHWVLKPHNSILWHDTVIQWLNRWCKADL